LPVSCWEQGKRPGDTRVDRDAQIHRDMQKTMTTISTKPILIVDDDRSVRHVLHTTLIADGYEVVTATSAAECVTKIHQLSPALVLLDLNLPDGNGIEVLKKIRAADLKQHIILMTAGGDSDSAILAARFGARDYLTKPLDLRRLRAIMSRALTPREERNGSSGELEIVPIQCHDVFIGRSREMQEVFKAIGRVAKQPVSVLIRGESGTGKELVARAIWQHSERAHKVFLAINCAALSDELLESELFGHEKGAFTGADQRQVGRFEVCREGTLFLDEIGDTRPSLQAKLLRVLQERRFTRVGGTTEITTDARIISATNRQLEAMCRSGQFREDLFHRLNGFSIFVPALRDRGGDIALLLGHFLQRYNQKLSKEIEAITPDATRALLQYPWPGNVRELESLISQVMLNLEGTMIDLGELPPYIAQPNSNTSPSLPRHEPAVVPSPSSEDELSRFVTVGLSGASDNLYAETLEFMERYLLYRVLQQTGGNQSAAARRLGITRGSLRFKLRSLGLSIDNQVTIRPQPR
jgi:DNA-binding NtrC family response regulator